MDLKIEIYLWDVGYDEAHETADKIGDLLSDRGYGCAGEDHPVKALIIGQFDDLVRGYDGETETANGVPEGLEEFLREKTADCNFLLLPLAPGHPEYRGND